MMDSTVASLKNSILTKKKSKSKKGVGFKVPTSSKVKKVSKAIKGISSKVKPKKMSLKNWGKEKIPGTK